jgi:C4-dicarboxylate transporter DctM subunit
VPIGVALGIASLAAIIASPTMDITFLVRSLVSASDSFPIMAVPFFILAGEIMSRGGISERLLDTARALFGNYTGGLGLVTVATCMFFAAISGSGPATVAAIGSLMIPSMTMKGYSKDYSSAIVASAGSIGVIIPPSIPMVVYSVAVGTSISSMFIAGILPGIFIGFGLIVLNYFISKKAGYVGDGQRYTIQEKLKIIWDAKWSLLVPLIILGGIYGGIFTPTEAAAVAVLYGLVVGVFVYRDIRVKELFDIFRRAGLTTVTATIILGAATALGRILTMEQVPVRLAGWITSFTDSKIVILLLINILLLIVGCFMETLSAILILAPILLPVVTAVGVDPIHFGIIMVVNLAIGFITPPVGVNLFVACGIAKIPLENISKAIVKPLIVMIIVLLFITYVPQISLTLPGLMR